MDRCSFIKKIDHHMLYYKNYRYRWNIKKMIPIQYRNHLLVV
ncbi:IS3 family transposase [Lysinibacillus sp. NPDC096418]